MSTAMPLKAMKPTAALMVKGMPRRCRPKMPPVTASGTHEDERGLPEGAEAEEDEHEDQGEREGHDDHEASLGFLQIFELAAELEVVAVREPDLHGWLGWPPEPGLRYRVRAR